MAVRVTATGEPTALWVIVNVAVVAPAGTVTDAGTLAADAFELERVTTVPPAGATAFRVTVPVTTVVEPPFTEVRFRVNELSLGGRRVSVSVFVAL